MMFVLFIAYLRWKNYNGETLISWAVLYKLISSPARFEIFYLDEVKLWYWQHELKWILLSNDGELKLKEILTSNTMYYFM